MSNYAMALTGMVPLGSLLGGFAADRIGAAETFRIGGAICFCGALIFYRALPKIRASVRPHLAAHTPEALLPAEN
jgi:hypothetical protein